jgi:hypothetical protein
MMTLSEEHVEQLKDFAVRYCDVLETALHEADKYFDRHVQTIKEYGFHERCEIYDADRDGIKAAAADLHEIRQAIAEEELAQHMAKAEARLHSGQPVTSEALGLAVGADPEDRIAELTNRVNQLEKIVKMLGDDRKTLLDDLKTLLGDQETLLNACKQARAGYMNLRPDDSGPMRAQMDKHIKELDAAIYKAILE